MKKRPDLIEELKSRGVRLTPQRAIILQAIQNLQGHMTAEDIFNKIQAITPYISLATVYRTLDLLKELGLIIESHMGTGTAYYALRSHGPHHHAVCRATKQTIELPSDFFEPIVDRLRTEYDFVVDDNHIVIFGWFADQTPNFQHQNAETEAEA